jgi:hypothetical protein
MIGDLQAKQRELEDGYVAKTAEIDKSAEALYKKSPEKAVALLTDFSVKAGNATVMAWKELYKFLFTKFVDGNVKTKQAVPKGYNRVNPKVSQPGYSEEWYRAIAGSTGDKLKEK